MVSQLMSRSLMLQWNPPNYEARNGIIRKYLVNVTGKFEDLLLDSIVLETHNTTLLVSDLHPNNHYIISVTAFTISEGPFTDDLQVTTSEDGECSLIQYSHTSHCCI